MKRGEVVFFGVAIEVVVLSASFASAVMGSVAG